MGSQSTHLKPIWTQIWSGCIKSFETRSISRNLCDDRDSEKGGSRQDEATGHTIGTTGCVNRHWSIAWSDLENVFDPSSFGYRKGRKTADALTKIWREVEAGNEWIVDADLKDYFGSVDHEKLMTLVGKQIADSRVLKLIQQMLKAGY